MKNKFLILVVTIFCFVVNAQDQNSPLTKSDIKFGLKGGMNFSLITGDGTDNFDGKISFHIGAVTEIPISDTFSLQPELVYSSQGDKEKSDGMELKYKLDYLNLPIIAVYYVSEAFSLEVGPQIGFLLSAKAESEGVSIDLKDIVKQIDFSLGIGLGYKLENRIKFSARYNLGLSNIFDNKGSIQGIEFDSGNTKNQNEVFQLSVGYFF